LRYIDQCWFREVDETTLADGSVPNKKSSQRLSQSVGVAKPSTISSKNSHSGPADRLLTSYDLITKQLKRNISSIRVPWDVFEPWMLSEVILFDTIFITESQWFGFIEQLTQQTNIFQQQPQKESSTSSNFDIEFEPQLMGVPFLYSLSTDEKQQQNITSDITSEVPIRKRYASSILSSKSKILAEALSGGSFSLLQRLCEFANLKQPRTHGHDDLFWSHPTTEYFRQRGDDGVRVYVLREGSLPFLSYLECVSNYQFTLQNSSAEPTCLTNPIRQPLYQRIIIDFPLQSYGVQLAYATDEQNLYATYPNNNASMISLIETLIELRQQHQSEEFSVDSSQGKSSHMSWISTFYRDRWSDWLNRQDRFYAREIPRSDPAFVRRLKRQQQEEGGGKVPGQPKATAQKVIQMLSKHDPRVTTGKVLPDEGWVSRQRGAYATVVLSDIPSLYGDVYQSHFKKKQLSPIAMDAGKVPNYQLDQRVPSFPISIHLPTGKARYHSDLVENLDYTDTSLLSPDAQLMVFSIVTRDMSKPLVLQENTDDVESLSLKPAHLQLASQIYQVTRGDGDQSQSDTNFIGVFSNLIRAVAEMEPGAMEFWRSNLQSILLDLSLGDPNVTLSIGQGEYCQSSCPSCPHATVYTPGNAPDTARVQYFSFTDNAFFGFALPETPKPILQTDWIDSMSTGEVTPTEVAVDFMSGGRPPSPSGAQVQTISEEDITTLVLSSLLWINTQAQIAPDPSLHIRETDTEPRRMFNPELDIWPVLFPE
jgi:hypothetical protein